MVDGAEQLPAVKYQLVAFVHTTGDFAVLLDPVRDQNPEGLQRVEVQGESVSRHR